ncbi:MFS transporter [Arthrobacter sp. 35W]|uniref:MFS transporter n=1 Tax=Arthrobacter sp. 35W TaxID=1132441 RepID=UPI00040C12BC|nr:MFS transporter [Arthrobacter sp. 35W]
MTQQPVAQRGAPAETSIWSPQYRKATIGLFGLGFMVAYSVAAITTAMPKAAAELNGLPLYGLAFAVTMATSVVSMAVAALWIDRAGPLKPLLTGVAIYAIGLLLAAGAPTMEILVGARALQGIGTGLDSVALYVVIARVFPAQLRPPMFGALAAAWLLPSIVGPAISGLVTDHFGWRWVFVSVPVLAVAAAALAYSGIRGAKVNVPLPADDGAAPGPAVRRAALRKPLWAAAAAAAVLALGDASARVQPWWVPELLLAIAVLAFAVPRLLPRGTWLALRGLPSLVLMRGLVGTAFTVADVYLPLYMIEQRGMPAWLAGLSLTVSGVTWSIGAWMVGRGMIGQRRALVLGSFGVFASVGVVALVLLPGMPVWLAWVGWTIGGLAIGWCYPTQSVLVLEKSAPSEQGSNSSALQLSETLTTSASLGVVGAVFASLIGMGNLGYAVAFGVSAAMAGGAWAVARRAYH